MTPTGRPSGLDNPQDPTITLAGPGGPLGAEPCRGTSARGAAGLRRRGPTRREPRDRSSRGGESQLEMSQARAAGSVATWPARVSTIAIACSPSPLQDLRDRGRRPRRRLGHPSTRVRRRSGPLQTRPRGPELILGVDQGRAQQVREQFEIVRRQSLGARAGVGWSGPSRAGTAGKRSACIRGDVRGHDGATPSIQGIDSAASEHPDLPGRSQRRRRLASLDRSGSRPGRRPIRRPTAALGRAGRSPRGSDHWRAGPPPRPARSGRFAGRRRR